MARLKERYNEEIREQLIERFGYSSAMQAPRLQKITLNMGVGDAKQDSKVLDAATEQLATIAGQHPSVRRARKSIAQFKVREGMPVGLSVTLRRERAYEFLDRLMTIAIPRIRDFRGLKPTSFDGRGNYSLGVREQIIFPEIDYDSVDAVRGLDVTITTSAPTDAEAYALLEAFGMPFSREGNPFVQSETSSSPRTERAPDGEDLAARAPGAPRQVQDPRVHPLPPLRPRALGVPQVRCVPHLPARARAQRLRAGHDEELLVIRMSMTDPVSDFLTRVRNGITAAHQEVEIPSSRLKREMARILKEQGYIRDFEIESPTPDHPGELIRVTLKYTDERRSAITGLKRVSRPGQRHYVGHTEIPKVLGGMGTAIVSTSRGVMTGHEARDAGVGGEVVAHIW